MNSVKASLIGQLIGLARATDGNEHLISAQSTAVIRQCLGASPDCIDAQQLWRRVEEVKRAMVPDCFLCANPCGKSAPFDLSELNNLSESERAAKEQILETLLETFDTCAEPALYRGLIALGMDGLSIDFLHSIAEELKQ